MGEGPRITAFFDEATNSVSYLVADPASGAAAVIDPVLDFDVASGRIATRSAGRILAAAQEQGAAIAWVLETHPHADHLTAAHVIRERTGARVGVGAGIREVQRVFAPLLGADDVAPDGGDFDRLFNDGDAIALGDTKVEVMATPGHTPARVTYVVADAAFIGDTLFMPDYGTARCDFPGGDARRLYKSIQRILSLPDDTRLFLCHDYKAQGRDVFAWETTVAEQRLRNVHIGGGVDVADFVEMREKRDATLTAPKLLYPAIQVNIRAGRLPPANAQGRRFITIPLTVAGGRSA
jgi:glyoxylase-like metal-dependent hydrolase (beta-lactamase superfamily II)